MNSGNLKGSYVTEMGRNFAILCLLWFCRSIHLTTYPLAVLADSRWIAESALRFGDSARMSALSLSNAAIWLQNRIAGQLKTYSLNIHWFPFVGRWLAHLQQVQCGKSPVITHWWAQRWLPSVISLLVIPTRRLRLRRWWHCHWCEPAGSYLMMIGAGDACRSYGHYCLVDP